MVERPNPLLEDGIVYILNQFLIFILDWMKFLRDSYNLFRSHVIFPESENFWAMKSISAKVRPF